MSASPPSADQPDPVKPACPVAGELSPTRASLREIDESVAAQSGEITAKLTLPCQLAQAGDRLEAWRRIRRGGAAGGSHQEGSDDA